MKIFMERGLIKNKVDKKEETCSYVFAFNLIPDESSRENPDFHRDLAEVFLLAGKTYCLYCGGILQKNKG